MLVLKLWLSRRSVGENENTIHAHWTFAVALGFAAGAISMLTNAAGPIMAIYLLAMGLPKREFMGTGAWYFFIANWLKIPFSAGLEIVTAESLKLDFILFPIVGIGAVAGIFFVKYVPQKAFNAIILTLAAAAAVKLLF